VDKIIEGSWHKDDPRRIFVAGARWWEYHITGGTMWQSDIDIAEEEATRRYPQSDKVLLPRALTAENGSKAALIGEFSETTKVYCSECGGDYKTMDDCETCGGTGAEFISVLVSWTTIKAIYAKVVEHFTEGI